MATRLYLQGQQAYRSSAEPNSWSTGWNKTNTNVPMLALPLEQLAGDAGGSASIAAVGTSGQFTAVGRHISPPLAAQTISGTLKGVVSCNQVNTTDNFTLAIAVKVIAPDGSDRGVLIAVSASDDTSATPPEMATSFTARRFRNSAEGTDITISSLAVSAGDRLVIETGIRQASTSTALPLIFYRAGSSNSDLPEDDTTADNSLRTWVEFSGTVTFEGGIYPVSSSATPEDGAAAVNTANPSTVVLPISVARAGDLILMVAQQRAAGATLTVNIDGGRLGPRRPR